MGRHLFVLDITDPTQPLFVGQSALFPDDVQGIALQGSTAYLADGAGGPRLIDISSAAAPIEIGSTATVGQALDVVVMGSLPFVADSSGGLRIFNIAAPSQPVEVGAYATQGFANSVLLGGDLAYVTDGLGLRIIDVSNVAEPVQIGSYDLWTSPRDVKVQGDYAFVASPSGALDIFDVSTPANPILTGTFIGTGSLALML